MRHTSLVMSFYITAFFTLSCSAAEQETECLSYKKSSSTMNATQLFDAATVCWAEGEKDLSAYFQILGQIRAITDMALYTPQEQDKGKVTNLYSKLYYQFGGTGDDLIFRSAARYNALISQIENTSLSNENGYSPGWQYKPNSKTNLYSLFLNSTKKQRLWQLESFQILLSNDTYFEAHIAASQLRAKNQTFRAGTEVYEEYQKLNEIMRLASLDIEKLPPPEDNAPYHLLVEIDPDANFVQLDTNYNGPENGQIELFENGDDVLKSWVAQSYETNDLEKLLNKINFDNDVLMVFSIGKMTNHSGKIVLNTFEKKDDWDSYKVSVSVGVISPKCEVSDKESFPFILATAQRIKEIQVTSRSRSNFPDKCGPIVSGIAASRQ